MNGLEQYTRLNDDDQMIVTGLAVKPRSYACTVCRDDGGDAEAETTSTVQQVATLESKGITLEACHALKIRSPGDKQAIILMFVNHKHKNVMLKLKGSNVFLNQHLTKINADIARRARQLRKQTKI